MWLIIAFGVAFSEASKDIFFSRREFAELTGLTKVWVLATASLPLLVVKLIWDGIPDVQPVFWVYSVAHSLILIGALSCHMRAITKGSLSQVQPMLAMTGIFLIATNPIMTNEHVTVLGWVGVVIVTFGIYATQHSELRAGENAWTALRRMIEAPGVGSMLAAAFLYSFTANLDRLAMDASSASWYVTVDLATVSILLGAYLAVQRLRLMSEARIAIVSNQALHQWPLIIGGFINANTFLLHMWALTFTTVPYLISVRRSSIIFASLWGYFVRKERAPHWYRIVGMFLVVGGIAIIMIYGRGKE